MMRVEGGELDMGKLAQVDALADEVVAHAITPDDGVAPARRRSSRAAAVRPRALDARPRRDRGRARGVLRRLARRTSRSPARSGSRSACSRSCSQRSTDQARVFELVGAAFAAFAAGVVSALVADDLAVARHASPRCHPVARACRSPSR